MRLTPEEVAAIKAAASNSFGDEAIVRLFGSRVDDTLEGGDIDLHVEVSDRRAAADGEIMFRRILWRHLDTTDVDVVIAQRGAALRWIDKAAYRSGIIL